MSRGDRADMTNNHRDCHEASSDGCLVVYLVTAVAAAVCDRHCGVFRDTNKQPCVEHFVTGTDFVRVCSAMFWTSVPWLL